MPQTICVVIPLYNKAPHIAATIMSVLSQSHPADEILVVNDGSTDDSADIVRRFLEQGVRLIEQKNAGVSAARNSGIQAARCEYVAFLDADDVWLPDHLLTLSRLIKEYPGLSLYSTLHRIQYNGTTLVPRSTYPLGFNTRVDDFFSAFAYGLSLVNSSTACVNREILLHLGGFPVGVRRGEDIITWIKLAMGFGMAHAAKVTAIYNRDAVNRSTAFQTKEPPESLVYLLQLIESSALDEKMTQSARHLFERIAFYTGAGLKETSDIEGLAAIRKYAGRLASPRLNAMLAIVSIVPAPFLTFARHFRHRSGEFKCVA